MHIFGKEVAFPVGLAHPCYRPIQYGQHRHNGMRKVQLSKGLSARCRTIQIHALYAVEISKLTEIAILKWKPKFWKPDSLNLPMSHNLLRMSNITITWTVSWLARNKAMYALESFENSENMRYQFLTRKLYIARFHLFYIYSNLKPHFGLSKPVQIFIIFCFFIWQWGLFNQNIKIADIKAFKDMVEHWKAGSSFAWELPSQTISNSIRI